MKILILDDDASCALAMASYFVACGFELEVVSALPQAETLLAGGAFDAVITEASLSRTRRGEGLALLRFVHEHGLRARVVIVAAHDNAELRQTAARLGAERFFAKPVPLEQIAAVLNERQVNG